MITVDISKMGPHSQVYYLWIHISEYNQGECQILQVKWALVTHTISVMCSMSSGEYWKVKDIRMMECCIYNVSFYVYV